MSNLLVKREGRIDKVYMYWDIVVLICKAMIIGLLQKCELMVYYGVTSY